jgi:UDP-glucose 4-epimerase
MKLEEECKVLVTGGAGFLGSHLAEALLKRRCEVIILDNLSTGFMENVSHLLNYNNKVHFIEGDIRDPEVCLKATKEVDIIFHEAAQINPVLAVVNPLYDFEVNARGTLNLLEAARHNHVQKFIFASTNVYGDPKYLPIDENHPMDLLSPYAASKLSGEAYCMVYNRTYGVETVRLRYTNLYGPRQRSTKSESGVVPIFIERVMDGKPPIIFGDGEKTRDFVYVSDVANANILAAESEHCVGEVFNIGSGKETSIKTLAEMVLRIWGNKDLIPIHGPPRKADFQRCRVDTTKARNLLGFRPEIQLEEGLKKTIDWAREENECRVLKNRGTEDT